MLRAIVPAAQTSPRIGHSQETTISIRFAIHTGERSQIWYNGFGRRGCASTAAITNAVHDAPAPLGIEINVTPLTLPPVLAATSLACSLVRGP
jgi:hypothetical protein